MIKPPALNPINAVVLLLRAKAHEERKQFVRALADLAEALRLNPQSGKALMVRATAQQAAPATERRR
jgi:hypothetical protein